MSFAPLSPGSAQATNVQARSSQTMGLRAVTAAAMVTALDQFGATRYGTVAATRACAGPLKRHLAHRSSR